MEEEFLKKLDHLHSLHNINDTREFLEDSLAEAIKNKQFSLIFLILNEMIGFFRDISSFTESKKYADALFKICEQNEIDPLNKMIAFINIANSYRAYGDIDNAINLFKEALNIYNLNNFDSKKNLASIYNNLALAYEEIEEYDLAVDSLLKALAPITESADLVKISTTYTNLAMCYIALSKLDLASKALDEASKFFESNYDDFHFPGYAAARAKLFCLLKDNSNAIYYYEKALSYLDMNVGKNKEYNHVFDELKEIYKEEKVEVHIKGIELSKTYYDATKDDLFSFIPQRLYKELTIGLFGLGSECYGTDDLISEDHDFDPGYIVLVNDNVTKEDFEIIKNAYSNLNKHYRRYYVKPLNKKGVHYVSDYLDEFLGIKDINNFSNESKALFTNGEIFYSGLNSNILSLRRLINKNYRYDFIPNLITLTLELNQYLPYNLNRAKERSEEDTYKLLRNHLVDKLIEYYYLLNLKFLPHDKLRFKLMNKKSKIYEWIMLILNNKDIPFEDIKAHLLNKLFDYGLISKFDTIYIEDYFDELIYERETYIEKKEIIEKIVTYELKMFQSINNLGGKADCQNNPKYFKLMRESQFYTWNLELLNSYLFDLEEAFKNNYNLLEIKYAFMEETVDPTHYETLKQRLPIISEKRNELIEQIVSVQVEAFEAYQKRHPLDATMMRSLYTKDDTINNTSYETYLRGELKSYSEKTMFLYAKHLTTLTKNGNNIVELTLNYTKLLRVDESVD